MLATDIATDTAAKAIPRSPSDAAIGAPMPNSTSAATRNAGTISIQDIRASTQFLRASAASGVTWRAPFLKDGTC
ncbi:hypothetical protein GCM10025870_08410 [Agromyces marinus]|uniref:Uncharacterized protein n=1 Tax=Agromyces marinus TaxID=1389020 RepID=A0ABM8GZ69_9MICO|nr:hypothetical protein [Agromyces marinus]BDZ53768.1 hypothetical protein GCM10025870_08410 [Agromyces marinus]